MLVVNILDYLVIQLLIYFAEYSKRYLHKTKQALRPTDPISVSISTRVIQIVRDR